MINDIVAGVTSGIYSEFGADYKIYTEQVEQGLKEPCFFVKVVNSSIARIRLERYQLSVSLDVHYFPAAVGKYADINRAAMALHAILRRITLANGDMMNGFDINWQCVDGVLHFFVAYRPFVRYADVPTELMETLSVDEYVR